MDVLLEMANESMRHIDDNNSGGSEPVPPPPPPPPPPRSSSYVSMFCIDGQPILPPLMTHAKRSEMQSLRELAIILEGKRKFTYPPNINTVTAVAEAFAAMSTKKKSSPPFETQRLQHYQGRQPRMRGGQSHAESKTFANASTSTDNVATVLCKRVQHLQRSETIIYDNRCNSIIMPIGAVHEIRKRTHSLMMVEEQSNQALQQQMSVSADPRPAKPVIMQTMTAATQERSQRPNSLTLNAVTNQQKLSIPEICVNPPTPIIDKHISLDTIQYEGDNVNQQSNENSENDENIEFYTPRKELNAVPNVKKVLHFDVSHNEDSTKKAHLGNASLSEKLKRSSTSPALGKVITKVEPQQNVSMPTDTNVERSHMLMRSNSFTLERPSKVLLDHMERQQSIAPSMPQQRTSSRQQLNSMASPALQAQQRAAISLSRNNMATTSPSPPDIYANLRRDTVESKAKRVTKTEVKQRITSSRGVCSASPIKHNRQKTTTTRSSPTYSAMKPIASHISNNTTGSGVRNDSHSNSHTNASRGFGPPNNSTSSLQNNIAANTCSNRKSRPIYDTRGATVQHATPKRTPKKPNNNFGVGSTTKSPATIKNCPQRGSMTQRTSPTLSQQHNQALIQAQQQQRQARLQQLQLFRQHQQQQQKREILAQQQRAQQQQTLVNHQMLNEIESAHRQKFIQLIAHQHEEQRRLQAQFDLQQRMLLDQISSEMGNAAQFSGDDSRVSASDYTTDYDGSGVKSPRSVRNTPNGARETAQCAGSARLSRVDARHNHVSTATTPASSPSPPSTVTTASILNSSSYAATTTASGMSPIKDKKTTATATVTPTSPAIGAFGAIDDNENGTRLDGNSNRSTKHVSPQMTSGGSANARKRLFSKQQCQTSNTKQTTDFTDISERDNSVVGSPISFSSHESRRRSPQLQLSNNNDTMLLDEEISRMQYVAATKINAVARGYLVRRLFRTEQIQRIVQTIRDTLIFVLNLHMETMNTNTGNFAENDTPANIRLKARLLQQLCSASRTLHLVFFQTSLKERMEIIARDRKRLKTKRINMTLKR